MRATGATCPGGEPGSLCHLGFGDHAAADARGSGGGALSGFLARFPTLLSLALAPEQEVLALWSGLGYYRRARMLHKAAQFVAEHLEGNLPVTAEELRMLPGIGAYTAAAIASIAHGEPVAVVDGNVERVLCRLEGWEAGSRSRGGAALRRKIEALAAQLVDPAAPGDFNQAMMELGATVCLPRNPQCLVCPLAANARRAASTRRRRVRRCRAAKWPMRSAVRSGGRTGRRSREVLLEQRPATLTVMPGLWELPALREAAVPARTAHDRAPRDHAGELLRAHSHGI